MIAAFIAEELFEVGVEVFRGAVDVLKTSGEVTE